MISKETRFVDLPQEIKQKLINIHKMSQQKYVRSEPISIVNFNYLYSQTVDIQSTTLQQTLSDLYKTFETIEKVFNGVKRCIDFSYVEKELKDKIDRLKEEIEIFNGASNNLDFCGELERTFKTLEKRFEDIKQRENKRD